MAGSGTLKALAFGLPLAAAALFLALVDPSPRAVRLNDLCEGLRPRLAANDFEFGALLDHARTNMASRLEAGEHETLVYFLLQSDAFTSRAAIDPLTLARQTAAQDYKPTVFVRARIRDFLAAMEKPAERQRLTYWQTHLTREQLTVATLELYLHETLNHLSRADKNGTSSYPGRSLLSDTTLASSFAISGAAVSLRRLDPKVQVEKVLIVGPGHDFAPPGNLHDDIPPQSYEPYLAADALLASDLAEEPFLNIHCFDINARVLHFLEEFKRSAAPKLTLPVEPASNAFNSWFETSGRAVGIVSSDAYKRTISVRPGVAKRVTGEKLDIVTERLVPSPGYDLVIAFDVLRYFREKELSLALANIQAMIRPGGYFIHNDARAEAGEVTGLLEMPVIQRGSVNLGANQNGLYFIHRRL